MLNQYQWNLYKRTEGKDTIKVFDEFICSCQWRPFITKMAECHKKYCPDKYLSIAFQESATDSCKAISEAIHNGEIVDTDSVSDLTEELSYEEIASLIDVTLEDEWSELLNAYGGKEKNVLAADIAYESIWLAYLYPSCFLPYGYLCLYNVFEDICTEFGIDIPSVPAKNNYKKRFLHYGEICKALQRFRIESALTITELWAFLFEYANGVIGAKQWISSLSAPPRRAFFIGANKDQNGDAEFLRNTISDPNAIVRWQGSPDAERNDVHVMYCLSPVSAINSVWQAVSDGFIDPFFYFYRCIYLGKPIKTPLLTLGEIKSDKTLKELPLVRANMQGVNGKIIPSEAYSYLARLLESKALHAHSLPVLRGVQFDSMLIKNEAEVEEKLLEPLLGKLGFRSCDYTKQLPLRMGRGQAVYPDYAINYDATKNKEKAEYIIEAKFSIPTKKQLEIDLGQARTYARRLQASAIMLVSIEGIWLAAKKDDFSQTKAFMWQELSSSDNFNVVCDYFRKNAHK